MMSAESEARGVSIAISRTVTGAGMLGTEKEMYWSEAGQPSPHRSNSP